jgi:hypothetical protein
MVSFPSNPHLQVYSYFYHRSHPALPHGESKQDEDHSHSTTRSIPSQRRHRSPEDRPHAPLRIQLTHDVHRTRVSRLSTLSLDLHRSSHRHLAVLSDEERPTWRSTLILSAGAVTSVAGTAENAPAKASSGMLSAWEVRPDVPM